LTGSGDQKAHIWKSQLNTMHTEALVTHTMIEILQRYVIEL